MADDNNSIMKLFGFELVRSKRQDPTKDNEKLPSIVPKTDTDGAGYVTASGSHYGQYIDINGDNAKDNAEMIMKYRGVSTHPEVDAIEDIVNESISGSENEAPALINLDGVETSDKSRINEEFDNVCAMLNFNELGHDILDRGILMDVWFIIW